MAAAAIALVAAACEKPADPAAAGPPPTVVAPPDTVASALPALPALPDPVIGPDFVDAVAGANLFEIAEGNLALQRSSNAKVKDYASAMIAAHTKLTASLQAAIDASGQTLEAPTDMSDDLQTKLAALKSTAAAGFDKAYIADQIAAHQSAVRAMHTYAKRGDAAGFKTFAADTAPIVEEHLARAQALQASLP